MESWTWPVQVPVLAQRRVLVQVPLVEVQPPEPELRQGPGLLAPQVPEPPRALERQGRM